jgi:phage-related protein
MPSRKLEVEIIGDASSLHRSLGKASDAGDGFGRSLGRIGKYAGLALGGAALGGLAVTLRAGVKEFTEATQVAAQTQAVLTSTGKAAHVTAKEVDTLADSIRQKTGVDDEAVASGENLLLTFTNIRNEVGKGNDIFNQATVAMTDMSVALGQDMKSSAIQVGKALNDPIKGITALRRVGVSFTEGQIEQVKAMVKTGHTMDAQKFILKELNKEFGGSAEAVGKTLPGQLRILSGSFSELAGNLVSKAAPALTTFVEFLNAKGVPAIGKAFGKISEVAGPALTGLFDTFKKAIPVILDVVGPLVQEIGSRLIPIFQSLQEIGGKAIAAIGAVIRENGPQLRQIFENLGTVISNLAKIVLPILELAFTKILPAALKILIPVLVITTGALAKLSDIARVTAQVITAVLKPVLAAVIPVVTALANAFTTAWGKVSAAVKTAVAFVQPLINGIMTIIRGMVNTVVGILTGDWARAWNGIKTVVSTAINGVKTYLQTVPALVLRIALEIGQAIIDGILEGVSSLGEALYNKLKGMITGAMGRVKGLLHIGSPSQVMADEIGKPMAEGVAKGIADNAAKVAEAAKAMVEKAEQALNDAKAGFATAFGDLASSALSAFDAAVSQWQPKAQIRLDKLHAKEQLAQLKKDIASATSDVSEKRSDLQAALAGGDPEQIRSAQEAVTAAIAQAESARRALRDYNLEQEARVQQEAHDKKMARQRIHLEDELKQVQNWLAKHPEQYREAQRRVNVILKQAGVDAKFWGTAIGIALADGMRAASSEVGKAAHELAALIAKYLKLKSPAEEGPMADLDKWWKPFASTLLAGVDTGAFSKAGVGVANAMRGSLAGIPAAGLAPVTVGGGFTGAAGTDMGVAQISIPVYLDSTQIAEVIRREYLRFEKRNGRAAL